MFRFNIPIEDEKEFEIPQDESATITDPAEEAQCDSCQ